MDYLVEDFGDGLLETIKYITIKLKWYGLFVI
jgi:hypothetical protein